MNKVLAICAVALLFSACTPESRVYEEHLDLSPNIEWKRSDVRDFQIPIEDPSKTYSLSLALRYISGYPWTTLPVEMTVTSPSGQSSTERIVLTLRSENGDYIGEAGGDIWDSTHSITDDFPFDEKGTYTASLAHAGPDEVIPFLLEIGLLVDDLALVK